MNGLYAFMYVCKFFPVFVGPCQHGTARTQVADGGTANDMEGSCDLIE
jgi:hypothetical protein